MAPPDPIMSINDNFKNDSDPRKVNLSVGAYRDNDGKPWILPSVREAANRIHGKYNEMEQSPITGQPEQTRLASELAFGTDCQSLKEGRMVSAQVLSGTGGLRLGFKFVRHWAPKKEKTVIHLPNPTWALHKGVSEDAGLKWKHQRYQNPKTLRADFQWMMEDLDQGEENDVVVLHGCAHNPTGCDINMEQWKELCELVARKRLIPFFDIAQQGYATGDLDADAAPLRYFEKQGLPILLSQSFAKNFGLQGHRVGNLSVVCDSKEEKGRVESQVKRGARSLWSSPPIQGSRIVTEILSSPDLRTMWEADIRTMAKRIGEMRTAFLKGMKTCGSDKDWKHVLEQIGMFAYTGITPDQVQTMADKHHVHFTVDGRISVAGLNTKNVDYVCQAFDSVTRY